MIMQITGSSAIANVNFKDASLVGITFTSQDTEYDFPCEGFKPCS